MSKKIAVVTDAVSPGFIFDKWYSYYSSLFGAENIYIITYQGLANDFRGFPVGGLIELPVAYNDEVRAKFISNFVNGLLACYDGGVVRVDVDEFLIPDQSGGANSLKTFLETFGGPYLTARGFDLIAADDEDSLELSRPIVVSQRRLAYGNSSLNKVAFTRIPVTWLPGFHSSSVYPRLDTLFLLHLKFVDTKLQYKWREQMSERLDKSVQSLVQYYQPDAKRLETYREGVMRRPIVDGYAGLYRKEHENKFYETIKYDINSHAYRTTQFHDTVLVALPSDFQDII